MVAKGDRGVFLADFASTGCYTNSAYLALTQTFPPPGWYDWREYHPGCLDWYGDIALAPTGDGGVVLFWSQAQERFGLFARRFSPAGEVTSVEQGTRQLRLLGLRFVNGIGILARVDLAGLDARLDLFDILGRRVAYRPLQGAGAAEVTLPETATLSSGLYFVRLAAERRSVAGKVAVVR